MMLRCFVGWDAREPRSYMVTVASLRNHATMPINVTPLLQPHLRAAGLYTRPQHMQDGQIYDTISDAPVSTEFALTRFLIREIAGPSGWLLFCDSDFMFRADVRELFDLTDPRYAVMVVKHAFTPTSAEKMDGRAQSSYPRKNWSSLMLWNGAHPAHQALTRAKINGLSGLDLHRFAWLPDDAIGALPEAWNWLEGHSDPAIEPKAVHFTRGTPELPGFDHVSYAQEWRDVLASIPGASGPLCFAHLTEDTPHGGTEGQALSAQARDR